MSERAATDQTVLGILGGMRPDCVSPAGMSDDTQLGSGGLGLDSIEIAELLLACEERYGVAVGDLLDDAALTFGRVVRHFGAT